MRRIHAIAILPAVFLFAACTGGDEVTVSPAAERPAISVNGHGEIETPSDTGYIDLGVQVQAATVAEARDRAAKAADAVIATVRANGVEAKDMKTSNLNISPQYDYSKTGSAPTIVGYSVFNSIEVKVRKLDTFSKVLDDATQAGGNDVRVSGIRFDVDDRSEATAQARERAMADAKQKGEQLARLGGVTLGKPLSISESQSASPPRPFLAGAERLGAQDAGVPTPIEPGTGTVSVDLTVVWTFE